MTTQEIVGKLWNLCNVLRDDGITYHQYVTELTYILFLKMAKETGSEKNIPYGYRWDDLTSRSGLDLKKYYKSLLDYLGEHGEGFRRFMLARRRILTNRKIWKRLSYLLMNWTGFRPKKKGWEIFTKACWRRTPMKRSPAQASILRPASLSTL